MNTNDEQDLGLPIAVSAADVATVVEAYRRAEAGAVAVRVVLAAAGLPHSEREVVATVNARGDPEIRLIMLTGQQRRRCVEALRACGVLWTGHYQCHPPPGEQRRPPGAA